jgi:hypothetical protein
MALWPAQRGRMDDWSVSATARAAASGQASNLPQSVTLTQAPFFMDDFHRSITGTPGCRVARRPSGVDEAASVIEVRAKLDCDAPDVALRILEAEAESPPRPVGFRVQGR